MFENATPVDIALAPSVDEFTERYVRPERPVVVRGAVGDWPPSHKWTPDYLKAMSGTRRVRIGLSTTGDYVAYADKLKIGTEPEVEFAKAIDGIFASDNVDQKSRVHQQPLDTWGPLNEESTPIPYIRRKLIAKNIWMGSRGNVTKLHYDTEDNINVQIRGRKEIILYPSTQLDELYPRSPWEYMANFSRVDIEKPDLSRFPLFSRATAWRAVLEPGDFLYIPIYWWHQFYTLEASINVNFWWQARAGQALRRQGVRYWPRMAKDGYLHTHIAQAIRDMGKSLVAR
ncbi:MAG TPA: cupin-like domain-containing protein [Steroidobacteraceae bacterium]|jgi:ribosomal protein L16 Arg81 hydroxylase